MFRRIEFCSGWNDDDLYNTIENVPCASLFRIDAGPSRCGRRSSHYVIGGHSVSMWCKLNFRVINFWAKLPLAFSACFFFIFFLRAFTQTTLFAFIRWRNRAVVQANTSMFNAFIERRNQRGNIKRDKSVNRQKVVHNFSLLFSSISFCEACFSFYLYHNVAPFLSMPFVFDGSESERHFFALYVPSFPQHARAPYQWEPLKRAKRKVENIFNETFFLLSIRNSNIYRKFGAFFRIQFGPSKSNRRAIREIWEAKM